MYISYISYIYILHIYKCVKHDVLCKVGSLKRIETNQAGSTWLLLPSILRPKCASAAIHNLTLSENLGVNPPKAGNLSKISKYVNICNFGLLNPILGKATWNNVSYFNFTWLYSKQNRLMATAPLTSTQIHCGIQGEHRRKLAMIVRLSANHRAFSQKGLSSSAFSSFFRVGWGHIKRREAENNAAGAKPFRKGIRPSQVRQLPRLSSWQVARWQPRWWLYKARQRHRGTLQV